MEIPLFEYVMDWFLDLYFKVFFSVFTFCLNCIE